jgi:hypothetical protein
VPLRPAPTANRGVSKPRGSAYCLVIRYRLKRDQALAVKVTQWITAVQLGCPAVRRLTCAVMIGGARNARWTAERFGSTCGAPGPAIKERIGNERHQRSRRRKRSYFGLPTPMPLKSMRIPALFGLSSSLSC